MIPSCRRLSKPILTPNSTAFFLTSVFLSLESYIPGCFILNVLDYKFTFVMLETVKEYIYIYIYIYVTV